MRVLAGLLVALAFAGPASAASGNLTVSVSGSSAAVTASYSGVPSRSTPEVVVQCPDYVATQAVSSGVPAVFQTPAEPCVATLFYYTWKGQRETGSVVLASGAFQG